MSVRPSNAAFFDIDETVIAAKSMFDFLRFWTAKCGDGAGYERMVSRIRQMVQRGVHRTVTNREYYRHFHGVPLTDLQAAGADWYARYRQRPDAFITATLSELRRHRSQRTAIVLVSGSFPICVQPLAEELHADLALCTEPLDDRFQGVSGRMRSGSAGSVGRCASCARSRRSGRGRVAGPGRRRR
ncbi:haloacid dehalogenase-like hydrolase [Micromonospora sp. Llam0]|uniref:haloacid dehalogenase-like hydrolase n=1 Tax=Micromonospora sp. Llam0 TaxID=2485143 RepID=UPI000F48BE27|nr:haloacid dehalogenase-like hydrolase [Micromonospora sp. Llam0]